MGEQLAPRARRYFALAAPIERRRLAAQAFR
jgi:hypothetical protein